MLDLKCLESPLPAVAAYGTAVSRQIKRNTRDDCANKCMRCLYGTTKILVAFRLNKPLYIHMVRYILVCLFSRVVI